MPGATAWRRMGNVISFPRVPPAPERRGPDRRTVRRGGRRVTDKAGYAPLVLLVDGDEDSNARYEAILAQLHFAIAPTRTLAEAMRVMEALRPNLIVAGIADAAALRQDTAADVPVVILSDAVRNPEVLVDEIRRELRNHRRR